MDRLTLPVLFLVAGADEVVDRDVTRAFFTRCAAADWTWREYHGAHRTEKQCEPGAGGHVAMVSPCTSG